jgi:transcriptional regulator with XRE-family HTH domain
MLNRIKALREARGIAQKALAEAAGVSGPFIYDLENGNRNAKPETWERIAAALGVTVEELVKEDEE